METVFRLLYWQQSTYLEFKMHKSNCFDSTGDFSIRYVWNHRYQVLYQEKIMVDFETEPDIIKIIKGKIV